MAIIEPLRLWVVDAMTIVSFIWSKVYAVSGTNDKFSQLLSQILDYNSIPKGM